MLEINQNTSGIKINANGLNPPDSRQRSSDGYFKISCAVSKGHL